MTDDDFTDLIVLLGLWAVSKYSFDVVPALHDAGKKIYEQTHPEEIDHANDLPLSKGRLSKKALINLATSVGFKDPKLAAAIAMAESAGIVNAIGDNGSSFGLWQIHLPAHPEYTREEMTNPLLNARAALKISRSPRGWKHWSTYNSGAYKRHL